MSLPQQDFTFSDFALSESFDISKFNTVFQSIATHINSLRTEVSSKTSQLSPDGETYSGTATNATNLVNAPSLSNDNNQLKVTAGGKTSAGLTVAYATTAGSATKAVGDESGNNIKASYGASLSLSGTSLSLVNKNNTSLSSVTLSKSNVGLGNVDNTSDANKSVKYATSAGSTSGTLSFVNSNGTTVYSFNGLNNVSVNSSAFFLTKKPVKITSDYFTGPSDHREFYLNIPKVSTSYFSWSFDIGSSETFVKSKKCEGISGSYTFTFQTMSGNTVTVNSDSTMYDMVSSRVFEYSYDGGGTWHDVFAYDSNGSYWKLFGMVESSEKPSQARFRVLKYYYI